jgi:hypothetical protein
MFSVTASGTIGDAITFSNWKGLPYVRARVVPSNPQTSSQVSVRDLMKTAVSAYNDEASVPAASRTSWNYYASGTGMSGFNRYVMLFMLYNAGEASDWYNPAPGDGKP